MSFPRTRLLEKLRRKFLFAPAGYGRPIPKDVLDREYTSGAWGHFRELPELARQSVIVGAVTALFPRPDILDVGCGSGRLAQLFAPHPFGRYLGLDLSTEGLRLARELDLPRCEFVEGDFETWRPARAFDVIMFTECIGYARDPGALTAAFCPYLKPGGVVVISHFRFGHWRAHWRRVGRTLETFESTTVTNLRGQTWDVKLLRPRTA
jgi:SAM-dependent methyltransferase